MHSEGFAGTVERAVMVNKLASEPSGSRGAAWERMATLSKCLVRHHDRIMFIVASRTSAKLSQGVSAEDLAHEVIVQALQHHETFEYQGEARFVRWISTLARRVVCHAARAHDRVPRPLSIGADPATGHDVHPSHIPGQTRTPSSIVARDERCRQVREVLASLREKDRTVIRMVQLEDRSMEEVAAAMDCSRDAAAKRLTRALGRLGEGVADCSHEHDW